MLTKSVDVRISRKIRPKTDILLLEHQLGSRSVEENLAIFFALNGKREGGFNDVKLKSGFGGIGVLVGGTR